MSNRTQMILFSYVPFWSTNHIGYPRFVTNDDIESTVNSVYDAHVPDVAAILYGLDDDDALIATMVIDRASELFDDMCAWSEHDLMRFFTVVCGLKNDGGYYFQLKPNLEESINRLCTNHNIDKNNHDIKIIYRCVRYESAPGNADRYNLLKKYQNVSIRFIDSKSEELERILSYAKVGESISMSEDCFIDVGTFALKVVNE